VLTPDEVVATVRDLWKRHQIELVEHERVRDYLTGRLGIPDVPEGSGDELKDIARLSVKNVLRLVVDAFSQSLQVEGYRAPGEQDNTDVWALWQRFRLDARQGEVHRPAVAYGTNYAVGLKDEIRIRSPRQMYAVYADPHMDLWPIFALEHWLDFSGPKALRKGALYDETHRYPVDLGNAGIRNMRIDGIERGIQSVRIAYDEDAATPHGADNCPVVRWVNDRDAEDLVHGEVRPLIRDQKAINAVNFDRLVVSRFGAFPQKYVIGWHAPDEGTLARMSAMRMLSFDDSKDEVQVGDFTPASVEPYNAILEEMIAHVATTAQIPLPSVSSGTIANLAADALAMMERPFERKLESKRQSFGESWEQLLRLVASLNNLEVPDNAEVVWAASESRSYAQVVDGISKLTAADPSLLPELLQDIPGWGQQRVDSARAALRRGAGTGILATLQAAAQAQQGSTSAGA